MKIWCFKHGETYLEETVNCKGHQHEIRDADEAWLDFHCLPFLYATCPPPEIDMDMWLERVWEIEPSDEELREIEAREILEDLRWLN